MDLNDLSLEEVNLVLQGLAKLPFENVNALIAKVHAQGQSQLPVATTEAAPVEEPTQ